MYEQTYRAALYMRLSKEDGQRESTSIANQRKLLTTYALDHGFFVVGEWVDDGYSGTNFQRPGFLSLLNQVEAGTVNLILLKDLSRLGRDYITAGQYTELYFPSRQVRVIAVNDGYDSMAADSDLIPFKHVMNEMYARDASRKIRSSLQSRMREGDFIGSRVPYGYMRDPLDKHHLIPDPETGPVVSQIFSKASLGLPPREIAQWLNGSHILSPSAYRNNKQCREAGKLWSSSTILKLLHNPVYLGHMAQGKRKKISFKSKTTYALPKQQWIWVADTHLPLVSQTAYDMSLRWLSVGSRARGKGFSNLFSGIARCQDCLSPMSTVKSGSNTSPLLACGSYKSRRKITCCNHLIPYQDLMEIVRGEILLLFPQLPPDCRLDLLIVALIQDIRIGQPVQQYDVQQNGGLPSGRRQSIHIIFTEKSPAWQWALDVTLLGLWDAESSTPPENG